MDSIKVIKKHGQPGGIPVVTVYVDEDAPGEYTAVKKYLHTITLDAVCTVIIINESSTAFTKATFAKWLYDNNYKSAGAVYKVTGNSITVNVEGNMVFDTMQGMYSNNETDIKITSSRKTLSFDSTENKLVVGTGTPTYTVSIVYDNVKII